MKKLILGLCLLMMGPLVACAQSDSAAYQEGVHYDRLSVPLRARSDNKIEVVEFFAYTCGHCYNFEPMVTAWKKQLPDDVAFVGSPAVWRPDRPDPLAQAFYTAQALGVLDVMHPVIFNAIHRDKKKIGSLKDLSDLFVQNGVSEADFNKAFNSFGVNSQVGQAASRMRGAQVTGTPELMVAGKYRVSIRKAGSQANMIKVADFLIERERAGAAGS